MSGNGGSFLFSLVSFYRLPLTLALSQRELTGVCNCHSERSEESRVRPGKGVFEIPHSATLRSE